MSDATQHLLKSALALGEDGRIHIATELLASLDGASDPEWASSWVRELERREEAAASRNEEAPEWAQVRARVLARLAAE